MMTYVVLINYQFLLHSILFSYFTIITIFLINFLNFLQEVSSPVGSSKVQNNIAVTTSIDNVFNDASLQSCQNSIIKEVTPNSKLEVKRKLFVPSDDDDDDYMLKKNAGIMILLVVYL